MTLAAAIMCVAVIVLGFIYKARVEIVKMDTVFLILAFIALGLWLIAKQPVLSAILTILADLLGFYAHSQKILEQAIFRNPVFLLFKFIPFRAGSYISTEIFIRYSLLPYCLVSRKQFIRSDAERQAETDSGEIALAGNPVL